MSARFVDFAYVLLFNQLHANLYSLPVFVGNLLEYAFRTSVEPPAVDGRANVKVTRVIRKHRLKGAGLYITKPLIVQKNKNKDKTYTSSLRKELVAHPATLPRIVEEFEISVR